MSTSSANAVGDETPHSQHTEIPTKVVGEHVKIMDDRNEALDTASQSQGVGCTDQLESKGLGSPDVAEHDREAKALFVTSSHEPTSDDTQQRSGRAIDPSGLQASEEAEEKSYLDTTPRTPRQGISPSQGPQTDPETLQNEGSTSEILSIMDQFGEDSNDEDGPDSGMLRRKEYHLQAPMQHPPRRSSLEPLKPRPIQDLEQGGLDQHTDHPTDKIDSHRNSLLMENSTGAPPERLSSLTQPGHLCNNETNTPPSPHSTRSLPAIPPPQPDPEPDLPFDFHRFLEQLRHRTADPVAKFLRSFLIEFGKKQWMAHEQVKIINDFLTFIGNKMSQCEVWRGVSDAEFDNAKEGMEKLVMNRLYSQTFSPAIPPPALAQAPKGKRKSNDERSIGLGRKGQHQEDIERDDILSQKVRIYGWVQEEHLDIPPVSDSGRRFLGLAQQGKSPTNHVTLISI